MEMTSSRTRLFLLGACLLAWVPALAQVQDRNTTTTVVLPSGPVSQSLFDQFDESFQLRRKEHESDNSKGKFAWLDSYLLSSYMQMYRATGGPEFLRRLSARFEVMLAHRDDRLGRLDDYTSTALPGWGASSYNRKGARWHVFIVHTGMICQGPADFVHEVRNDPKLQSAFGTTATLFRQRIEESIAGAEQYWRNGPSAEEGYYTDPGFGLLPLNQMNAMGSVLLVMHDVTGNPQYLDHATRLAHFFKNRLRRVSDHYEWAYWPKESDTTTATEDISHAAINVEFAMRCARRSLVFNQEDISMFARTWLKSVYRPDGSWAGTVGGRQESGKYMPGSAGRWLVLCEALADDSLKQQLITNVRAAYRDKTIEMPSQALGIAHLLRHQPKGSP